MPVPHTLIYLVTGAAAGLVGAMLGIGGGVFLVPLLTLAFGVPIRAAVAASLVSVIATATASSTVNLDRGLVNMRLAMALEVATSIGGLGGGLAASLLTTQQLFLIFGVTLAAMGILMMVRSGHRNVIADTSVDPGRLGGRLQEGDISYVYRVRRFPLALGASLVAGAVSGLLGLGGGIIKVPVLNTFNGIPIRVAAATSAFMIGVTAAASVFVYFARGDIVLPLTAAVAVGALPGSIVGARLGQRVDARALKIFMSVVLLLVGGRMALEAL
ncbi:MAG TPA: sulfite exporter TauE/SafE family protein [Vicinamibacteria bacterium]|nr:sulfite exporter TauE/SafE family protein [Vicinamibacteria bacterium]